MSQEKKRIYTHIPNHLFAVLQDELSHEMTYKLFNTFFYYKKYVRRFSLKLIDFVKNTNIKFFDLIMIALLILENQILKIEIDNIDELDFILTKINLKSNKTAKGNVDVSVLLEGYTTTYLPDFILEFRKRLERSCWIHENIKGEDTSTLGLRDFIHHARQPCKVLLARYCLTPEKVADYIMTQVKRSYGVQYLTAQELPYVAPEAEHTLGHMPAYERHILGRLCAASHIYWVSQVTSAALHAIVENPLTTVVLVVKPPGSDIEFEVKRTGMRGQQLLQVVYSRAGKAVPQAHRLHGGSMGRLLNWEAHAAALFAMIYRTVHQAEAPLSKTIAMSTIYMVPVEDGDVYITDYFTDARTFGDGFDAMRTAMAQAVAAFDKESSETMPAIPGALGLTLQFLSYVAPRQSILCGSSSLRIDRLVQYLSAQGPHVYFTEGLQVAYTKYEAQRFANDILEEILGLYTLPPVPYHEHTQYIGAALSIPENRARADWHYLSALQQIGTVWGTLLALHGYTRGESFVSRNVGLKSVWEQGQWQVKIIFMDHDDLHIMGTSVEPFQPRTVLYAMRADARHIARLSGDLEEAVGANHMGLLAEIYQVSRETWSMGHASFHQALVSAHRATREAIVQHPALQAIFDASSLQRMHDWDMIVRSYMATSPDASHMATWQDETRQWLTARGYHEGTIHTYIQSLEGCRDFLARYPFLY
jgi:hypothetical protein